MVKFPSYVSSILTGAIGTPIYVFGLGYIEKNSGNQLSLIVWSIFGFLIPVLISTTDIKYILKERKRGRSFFKPWTKPEAFRQFYIPAWKRMLVWLISAAIALFSLQPLD